MKNKLLLTFAIFFIIVSLSYVNARIIFSQQNLNMGNSTIRNHIYFYYEKNIDDYIKGNDFLEAYILYNIYPNKWNIDSINYQISFCNLTIRTYIPSQSSPSITYNKIIYANQSDIFNGKYFVKLTDKGTALSDIDCKFAYPLKTSFDIPAEQQLVLPTWECKSCQFYEASLLERDVIKAQSIGSNSVSVMEYIKKLINLNFEIILILFWIFLILLVLFSIGLIFLGVIWIFMFLWRLAK